MGNPIDPVKLIPIVRCEDCPFGIVKKAMSDSPMLVCRHPILGKIEKVIAKSPINSPTRHSPDPSGQAGTQPPEWCELTSFSELILRNRHDIIKIIEDSYRPLDINPFKKSDVFAPWKDKVWVGKTYQKRYWTRKMQEYDTWRKSLKSKRSG